MTTGVSTLVTDFGLIIATATLLGILAKKTKQPTIVAYILTGLILGPVVFGIVEESELTHLISELGLGFLLFLLGIEMNLKEIKEILRPVTNIAILQTILQTSLAFILPLLLGFNLMQTVVIALCTVFGATPVIVKVLTDKDEITSLPGKIDVGVLILQDIYLVIILALFAADTLAEPQFTTIALTLGKIFFLMGVITVLSLASSKYILPKLFKYSASNKHTFFIHGITWAFLFISLALVLDLSVEVGAFLAGLGLGQISYREELKERIRPLTDFFMVIFFSSIALTITRDNLFAYWKEAIIASIVLMIGNFLIMFYLIDREHFTPETSFLGSINMTQVSEFSIVVGALAVQQEYIGNDVLGYLSLMALLTMSTSSYLIQYNQELYEKAKPFLERFEAEHKKDVELSTLENHIVLVGATQSTKHLIPILKETGKDIALVDNNSDRTMALEARNDIHYIYGDISHGEIRKTAGIERADIIVSMVPNKEINRKIIMENPEALLFVKAKRFEEAAELYEEGAHYVMLKTEIAADQMAEYLEAYLEGPQLFKSEVKEDIERIKWSDLDQW